MRSSRDQEARGEMEERGAYPDIEDFSTSTHAPWTHVCDSFSASSVVRSDTEARFAFLVRCNLGCAGVRARARAGAGADRLVAAAPAGVGGDDAQPAQHQL